jgi:RNA polymerase sigma factor (TIGR02999 family)
MICSTKLITRGTLRDRSMSDVTRILSKIESGDPTAADQLLPLVYEELRKLAAAKLAQEKPGQTLQATALVHEVYLRLLGNGNAPEAWNNRGHFFGAAAEAMRRILIERARKRIRRERKVGGQLPLDDVNLPGTVSDSQLISLDDALSNLAQHDPIAAELVKLRFFAGLTMAQAAQVLGMPLRSAERNWKYARTWLHRQIEQSDNQTRFDL